MADIDAQIIPLALRQHGLFTRHQARAAGTTRHQFEHRLSTGVWERRSSVVLALAGAPASFEQSVMAACLQTEGNVASHRASAALRGVPQVQRVVEVTSLYGCSRNPFGIVHRSADLLSDDIELVGLIPATTLARTAADLFTCLRPARAAWIIEGLLGRGQLTIGELAEVHGRFARQGRPGTVHLRDLPAGRTGVRTA